MRAAVLDENRVLATRTVDIDDPGPGEVLIRTAAAGVCHSDQHVVAGSFAHDVPVVLGHESAGIVVAVGAGVRHVAPGDHVVTCPSVFCGECDYCLSGRSWLCRRDGLYRDPDATSRLRIEGRPVLQFAGLGGFAELMLVHERATVRIDRDIPLEIAALCGCAVTTGLGAVFRTAAVEPGSTVAVVGCGGIGLNAVQGALLAGAARIVAVDVSAEKLALAQAFGATDLVDGTGEEVAAQIRALTGGGVDYSFEAVGRKETAELCCAMLRRGGTATIVGLAPAGTAYEIPAALLWDRAIQGCVMGSNRFRLDVPVYLEYYRQGRLRLDELLSATIALDDVGAAFDAMVRGEVARSVIVFGS